MLQQLTLAMQQNNLLQAERLRLDRDAARRSAVQDQAEQGRKVSEMQQCIASSCWLMHAQMSTHMWDWVLQQLRIFWVGTGSTCCHTEHGKLSLTLHEGVKCALDASRLHACMRACLQDYLSTDEKQRSLYPEMPRLFKAKPYPNQLDLMGCILKYTGTRTLEDATLKLGDKEKLHKLLSSGVD